jgi:hypothetical protein
LTSTLLSYQIHKQEQRYGLVTVAIVAVDYNDDDDDDDVAAAIPVSLEPHSSIRINVSAQLHNQSHTAVSSWRH